MMKPLLGALVALNLGLLAANLGLLDPWLGDGQREPGRQARQVNPELVALRPVAAASAAASALAASGPSGSVAAAPQCLQSLALDAAGQQAAQQALRAAGVADGAWSLLPAAPLTPHLIVMGPYAERDQLDKKLAQVKRRNVPVAELKAGPELPAGVLPGLVLGTERHESEAAAEAALDALNKRGVRSARVVALSPVPRAQLRLPAVEAALQARLLALPGGLWQACAAATAPAASAASAAVAAASVPPTAAASTSGSAAGSAPASAARR